MKYLISILAHPTLNYTSIRQKTSGRYQMQEKKNYFDGYREMKEYRWTAGKFSFFRHSQERPGVGDGNLT